MELDAYRAGSTEPWTADLLAALVRAQQPHVLIETGTFEGRTTALLLAAMHCYAPIHSSKLFTVESDLARVTAAQPMLQGLIRTSNVGCTIVHRDALAFLLEFPRSSADFIFLDDDHDAVHVEAELEATLGGLRVGGLCCVHDVVGPFGLDSVVRSFGGLVMDFPRLHAAGGLGLVVKS